MHVENPDLQAKINRWVAETGRGADELVEDAVNGFFDELMQRGPRSTIAMMI